MSSRAHNDFFVAYCCGVDFGRLVHHVNRPSVDRRSGVHWLVRARGPNLKLMADVRDPRVAGAVWCPYRVLSSAGRNPPPL